MLLIWIVIYIDLINLIGLEQECMNRLNNAIKNSSVMQNENEDNI